MWREAPQIETRLKFRRELFPSIWQWECDAAPEIPSRKRHPNFPSTRHPDTWLKFAPAWWPRPRSSPRETFGARVQFKLWPSSQSTPWRTDDPKKVGRWWKQIRFALLDLYCTRKWCYSCRELWRIVSKKRLSRELHFDRNSRIKDIDCVKVIFDLIDVFNLGQI